MARLAYVALVLVITCYWPESTSGTPPPVVTCSGEGNTECSVYNYMGEWNDRRDCKVAKVVFPTTEEELVAAVADGVRNGQKIRVVSRGSHSLPKLVCPGDDGKGLLISTRDYNKGISVDIAEQTATLDAGVRLQPFLTAVAKYRLTFPHLPYWAGVSISGMLGTGAHGTGIWGKGSSVHEYVKAMRLVVPASAEEGYAKVITLVEGVDDEILNAGRVSLGVLGIISKVTLELQPLFKRSVTNVQMSDSNLENQLEQDAQENEFGDVRWYPASRLAVHRRDNRVPVSTLGEGANNYSIFQPASVADRVARRVAEKTYEATGNARAECVQAERELNDLSLVGNGFSNDGTLFTSFPVVGFQTNIAISVGCEETTLPDFGCGWDPRSKGTFVYQTTFAVAFTKVREFVKDVKALVALKPDGLCGLGLYQGVLVRYLKKSVAYLGEIEDSVDMDFTYYRSYNPRAPRMHQDVMEEIEQILLFKYRAKPHWGKNRNVAFATSKDLFPELPRFLRVKDQLDPQGFFSNEWTDIVLNVDGAASKLQKFEPFCALEGNCICSEDVHCAPEAGYFCQPGLIYKEARVCREVTDHREKETLTQAVNITTSRI